MPTRDPSEPDEADLLFGRVFPSILAQQPEALRKLGGTVEFRMETRPPRLWKLTPAGPPWITRGPVTGAKPDVVIRFTPHFVKAIFSDRAFDVAAAVASGAIEVQGELPSLATIDFDVDLSEAIRSATRPKLRSLPKGLKKPRPRPRPRPRAKAKGRRGAPRRRPT